jgi:hypothetical protein
MKRTFLLSTFCSLLLLPPSAFSMDRLSALSMLETGNDDRALGRQGEISRFQILPSEWRRYGTGDPRNPAAAASAVRRIMAVRSVGRCCRAAGLTNFDFYVLWNAPAQAGHPSPVVRERAQRFANLCSR